MAKPYPQTTPHKTLIVGTTTRGLWGRDERDGTRRSRWSLPVVSGLRGGSVLRLQLRGARGRRRSWVLTVVSGQVVNDKPGYRNTQNQCAISANKLKRNSKPKTHDWHALEPGTKRDEKPTPFSCWIENNWLRQLFSPTAFAGKT